jgi:hypothetical protein
MQRWKYLGHLRTAASSANCLGLLMGDHELQWGNYIHNCWWLFAETKYLGPSEKPMKALFSASCWGLSRGGHKLQSGECVCELLEMLMCRQNQKVWVGAIECQMWAWETTNCRDHQQRGAAQTEMASCWERLDGTTSPTHGECQKWGTDKRDCWDGDRKLLGIAHSVEEKWLMTQHR